MAVPGATRAARACSVCARRCWPLLAAAWTGNQQRAPIKGWRGLAPKRPASGAHHLGHSQAEHDIVQGPYCHADLVAAWLVEKLHVYVGRRRDLRDRGRGEEGCVTGCARVPGKCKAGQLRHALYRRVCANPS